MVAKERGLVEQTLRNWVKLAEAGKLNGKGNKVITPEQMDLSRLRAENIRLKRECEILKKATGDSTGHCNTAEIFCEGDKKFNVFLGRSFNSSAIISSCSWPIMDGYRINNAASASGIAFGIEVLGLTHHPLRPQLPEQLLIYGLASSLPILTLKTINEYAKIHLCIE